MFGNHRIIIGGICTAKQTTGSNIRAFGLGCLSEDRGDRLDIEFNNSGAKKILKTTELKPALPPSGFKFPADKVDEPGSHSSGVKDQYST